MQYVVTIGIPVFRAKDYVQNTMLSALAQTYPDIEFLVIDDCGNDGSMDIIEELLHSHPRGEHIRILRNSQNLGAGNSRNRIIDEARGRYLYFLDSDDTMEPGTIQLMMDAILHHDAEIVYASYEVVDTVYHAPNQIYQKPSLCLFSQDVLAYFAFKNKSVFQVSVCNSLINLSFLRQANVRFIDTAFWEDMAFTYELVPCVNRAVLLPDITYHYILRLGSLSHYQDREQLEKSEIMNNVSTINYLKERCRYLAGKPYLPYLCYNLEMSSFYIICHIIKHSTRISPAFTYREMRQVLLSPLSLWQHLHYREKLLENLLMWLLGHLPIMMFRPFIWLLGKLKKAI